MAQTLTSFRRPLASNREPYETCRLYALPYVGNSQLFYRKDLFDKHSLKEPATWDDVLAARTIEEKET
jgi:multiple sugar transport system substrate-binding protein